jgi:hypothetical protein
MPKVYLEDQMPDSVFEELVPFEWLSRSKEVHTSIPYVLRFDLEELISDMPDAVSYAQGQPRVAGVVTQPVGFGVSSGYPVHSIPYRVTAYRECASIMPISYARDTGMVLAVRDAAAAGGIQEGDFLVQIGGVDAVFKSFVAWAQSPLQVLRLTWKAGDSVSVAYIRPGVGRIEGAIKVVPSACSYRAIADSLDLKMGRIKMRTKSNGQVVWYFPDPY